jgi:hypothetical protein
LRLAAGMRWAPEIFARVDSTMVGSPGVNLQREKRR